MYFFLISEIVTEHLALICAEVVIFQGNEKKKDVLLCTEKLDQNKCLFLLKQEGYVLGTTTRLCSLSYRGNVWVLGSLCLMLLGLLKGRNMRNLPVILCV